MGGIGPISPYDFWKLSSPYGDDYYNEEDEDDDDRDDDANRVPESL